VEEKEETVVVEGLPSSEETLTKVTGEQ